jgi:hypothetical protein
MNREIADRSMWAWSPRGEIEKFKTMKISFKAVASTFAKFSLYSMTFYQEKLPLNSFRKSINST